MLNTHKLTPLVSLIVMSSLLAGCGRDTATSSDVTTSTSDVTTSTSDVTTSTSDVTTINLASAVPADEIGILPVAELGLTTTSNKNTNNNDVVTNVPNADAAGGPATIDVGLGLTNTLGNGATISTSIRASYSVWETTDAQAVSVVHYDSGGNPTTYYATSATPSGAGVQLNNGHNKLTHDPSYSGNIAISYKLTGNVSAGFSYEVSYHSINEAGQPTIETTTQTFGTLVEIDIPDTSFSLVLKAGASETEADDAAQSTGDSAMSMQIAAALRYKLSRPLSA